ncbi:MAG: peptide MFS transporter [Myxococcales bacterium]|nr:peptide MFS transporter [Myxococcales bacterium]
MSAKDRDRAFFGHPIGLRTLFFTEMWERFSYYGMRAFLMIYMIASLTVGGRGMTKAQAGLVMALFLSSVYLLSLPGGWIADRFLGQRKAVTIGGIGIAVGNALLALPIDQTFYPGLVMIAIGTGLLKPNISTIVGQLYSKDDIRRDAGFTIYYMGINIGATISPFICGYLAQNENFRSFLVDKGIDPTWCWHFGFAAAAIGMVGGLVQYFLQQRDLGESGLHPNVPEDPKVAANDVTRLKMIIGGLVAVAAVLVGLAVGTDIEPNRIGDIFGIGLAIGAIVVFYGFFKNARDVGERRRVIAMIPLFIGAIGFFGIFEQASTTLSVFAEDLTQRKFLGITIEASYYQSVNGLFIVALAPLFAAMWVALAKARKEPSSVLKFGIGMIFVALSFVVMLPTLSTVPSLEYMEAVKAGKAVIQESQKVSGGYLMALYFIYTCAELFISPVGLSSMSKLAPQRLAGMVMGTWFLGTAIGNYLAGRAAGFAEVRGFQFLFPFLIVGALVIAAGLFVVAPMIKRMMGRDSQAHDPADKSEKTEPEPLPSARVVKNDDN